MSFSHFGKSGEIADEIIERFPTVFACGSDAITNVGFMPGYSTENDIIGAASCVMHNYGYGDMLNTQWQNAVDFGMEEQGKVINITDDISVVCTETNPETKEAQLSFIKK